MKKFFLFLALAMIFNIQAQQRPKLVVGIVVDQMKMEYLYRFSDDFSPNGFKRLMNNGYTFQNMHYNYILFFKNSKTTHYTILMFWQSNLFRQNISKVLLPKPTPTSILTDLLKY